MPGFDGTGPKGMGPMTGGGRGFCASMVTNSVSPFRDQRFFGAGRGGRGFRNCFYASGLPGWMRSGYGYPVGQSGFTAENEAKGLKEEAEFLKRQLESVQNRIIELESQGKK